VWGNHDIGLCREPSERIRQKYAGPVLDFMTTLQPRLAIGDCLFTHVDPWLDPEDPMQIWWVGELPDQPGMLQRSLDAVPHRHLFVGHYHRWMLLTPEGRTSWQGQGPVLLDAPRTFVIIHAVHDGHCALFDTETRLLTPLVLA